MKISVDMNIDWTIIGLAIWWDRDNRELGIMLGPVQFGMGRH